MHALRGVHRCLVPGGILLDLQPSLADAPVVGLEGPLGRIDESEFRAVADRINGALEQTIAAGLFEQEKELTLDVVHRFRGATELLREVATWTGTKIPSSLAERLERSKAPFDVHEGAILRRLRAR